VEATIKTVQQLLAEEAHLSPALRAILEVMIMLVQIMANRLSLNSRNSSKPPSQDRFSKDQGEKPAKDDTDKKSGGQPGHIGTQGEFAL
jgi:transposase